MFCRCEMWKCWMGQLLYDRDSYVGNRWMKQLTQDKLKNSKVVVLHQCCDQHKLQHGSYLQRVDGSSVCHSLQVCLKLLQYFDDWYRQAHPGRFRPVTNFLDWSSPEPTKVPNQYTLTAVVCGKSWQVNHSVHYEDYCTLLMYYNKYLAKQSISLKIQ